MKNKFELPSDDLKLFNDMKGHYISKDEQLFFEQLKHKEQYEPTYSFELLLHEDENPDNLFIVRMYQSGYEIGIDSSFFPESLSEALDFDLFNIGHTEHIKLIDLLRQKNYYSLIRYDRNYDNL